MDALVVGIDVSKVQLDVHVRPSAESFVVPRNGAGLDELIARLQAIASAVIAVEATGGLECVVTAALAGAGLPVVVVNPAQVRAFANALGKRAKTDPIDAAVIAHFVEATKPDVRPLPDEATQLLADLVAKALPRSARRTRQTKEGRARRCRPQTPDHSQRNRP
jgi:transposase